MRPIDADALLFELANESFPQSCIYTQGRNGVIDSIRNAPTINAAPKWIPCEEMLPKDLEVVNITWINHRPMTYYADIKDKPFTATAIRRQGSKSYAIR